MKYGLYVTALCLVCLRSTAADSPSVASMRPVLDKLKDDDFRVRIVAAREIAVRGPAAAEAQDALVAALRALTDSDHRDAVALVRALLQIGVDPEPLVVGGVLRGDHIVPPEVVFALCAIDPARLQGLIPPLCGALTNVNTDVRRRAVETLGSMGPHGVAAIPNLIVCLKDSDALVRSRSADTLGVILNWLYWDDINPATKTVVEALIPLLRDEIYFVRFSAAVALGWIGPPAKDAIPALEDATRDSDKGVAAQATTALRKIGPQATNGTMELVRHFLETDDPSCQKTTFETLRTLGSGAAPIVTFLVERARFGEAHEKAKAIDALGAMGKMAKPAVPLLIETARSPDPSVRYIAIMALGFIGSGAADGIPTLSEALKDPNPGTADSAMLALSMVGERSVPALIEALGSPDAQVRARAAYALGNIHSLNLDPTPFLPALKKALADPDRMVRIKAAISLALKDPTARECIPILTDAIKETNQLVRITVATALASLGPEALPILKAASEKDGGQLKLGLMAGCYLPGGGGTVHIPPDGISSNQPTELKITFSVWGAGSGRLDKRYTDVICHYRINQSGEYNHLTGTVFSADDKHMEMVFVIPPLILREEDAVDYKFEMLFDGHKNTRSGGTLRSGTSKTRTLKDTIARLSALTRVPGGDSIPKVHSKEPTPADMENLGILAVKGHLEAIDELEMTADVLYKNINYDNESERTLSNLKLMRAAFTPIGLMAGNGSETALEALKYANSKKRLRSFTSDAFGIAAGMGNRDALNYLLNYKEHGFLLSSTISALRSAAERNTPEAVDFLIEVIKNPQAKPLWSAASQGLVGAAALGNKKAEEALKKYATEK